MARGGGGVVVVVVVVVGVVVGVGGGGGGGVVVGGGVGGGGCGRPLTLRKKMSFPLKHFLFMERKSSGSEQRKFVDAFVGFKNCVETDFATHRTTAS